MATSGQESFRSRQEAELVVIQSIFMSDVEDQRPKSRDWKPLNLVITLFPQQGSSGNSEAYARTKLHLICSAKYPNVIPKISLEESKGLSNTQIDGLTKELISLAQRLKGEEMILQLTQLVQTYLYEHNKPPVGSLHEEMMLGLKKREEDLLQKEQQQLSEKHKQIREEVIKRKEMLKSDSKTRDTRRSFSESSPTHHYRTYSSSENSEISTIINRCHLYPNECSEHRTSETLYFQNIGKKIQKGCCLGHSKKGCVAFSGIDLESGQLLYITEWNIKYSQFGSKCDDILQYIEKQVTQLSNLHHKNLITYECCLTLKKKEGVLLYVVQDFLLGTSVASITGSFGWCPKGVCIVAKGVLDGLNYLHNKGFVHGNLDDCSVFMDNAGVIRLTDFSLIPYLLDLVGCFERTNRNDLIALASLIESLSSVSHNEMSDFIEQCRSERTLSCAELLNHTFLQPKQPRLEKNRVFPKQIVERIAVQERRQSQQQVPSLQLFELLSGSQGQARIDTEFEKIKELGEGAYGDVVQVRNKLDNSQYAIKRIPLSLYDKQRNKKMTREVMLLSHLNHENVVRYYNSWIESINLADPEYRAKVLGTNDEYDSNDDSSHQKQVVVKNSGPSKHTVDDGSSIDWLNSTNLDDDDSDSDDGIEFAYSNSEEGSGKRSEEFDEQSERDFKSPRPEIRIMYIQMEFCEKSTLRTEIDDGLYKDSDRVWRYFREIVEGIAHFHHHDIIHRDLKPVNIFLNSSDQVKIGDFGLATTTQLAMLGRDAHLAVSNAEHRPKLGSALTGKVGTALYVAPELMHMAAHSFYDQKADIYSLGIIMFEMSYHHFDTAMERVNVLNALRSPAVVIPKDMLDNPKYTKHVQLLKWLLNHDKSTRPSAEELLASELLPPPPFEASELEEMLRHAFEKTETKSYKHIVNRCLDQDSSTALKLTYDIGLTGISIEHEIVKSKIIALFRRHGGVELVTPLLTPYIKNSKQAAPRMMTHSGAVVTLPYDLRMPFAKYVVFNQISTIRRYSIGRVYRENKVFNFHPKQLFECAFDVVMPNLGNCLIDAELISMAHELSNDIPKLKEKNIMIRMNHTNLLKAILLHCYVPLDLYNKLLSTVGEFIDRKLVKFSFQSIVTEMMKTSKGSATQLIDFLIAEAQISGSRISSEIPHLKTLYRSNRSEVSNLAKQACRDIDTFVTVAKSYGVTCPITIYSGLSINYNRTCTKGGIVWQMVGDRKSKTPEVFAVGGRNDDIFDEFNKQIVHMHPKIQQIERSAAGFSFALDKIVSIINPKKDRRQSVDVAVCVYGYRSDIREVPQIMRSFWASNIQAIVIEANTANAAMDCAEEFGASLLILIGEDGTLRVRNQKQQHFEENIVTKTELLNFLKRKLSALKEPGEASSSYSAAASYTSEAVVSNSTVRLDPVLPDVRVIFLTSEKPTANMRRRYETTVKQNMTPSLEHFGKKEKITVLCIDLPASIMKAIAGAIDPRNVGSDETKNEVTAICERYRRTINALVEEINDILSVKRHSSIVALYTLADSSYRIIL